MLRRNTNEVIFMFFLGNTFYSYKYCADTVPNSVTDITSIELSNGIYDNLFVSKNPDLEESPESMVWDYDTIFYALFKGNLLAGNLGVSMNSLTSLRIKVRKKGEYDWLDVFDIPINSTDDLNAIRNYRYMRSNTEYEVAMVPVLNGVIEGNMNVTEVLSEFEGVFFMSRDAAVHAFLNVNYPNRQRNTGGVYVETMGRKYPFRIKNGKANYESGSISATFINYTIEGNQYKFDLDGGHIFRKSVNDFLTDGEPKILKTEDGEMWLCCIDGSIPQDAGSYYKVPTTTINWTETGDCESMSDLYANGFTDIDMSEY